MPQEQRPEASKRTASPEDVIQGHTKRIMDEHKPAEYQKEGLETFIRSMVHVLHHQGLFGAPTVNVDLEYQELSLGKAAAWYTTILLRTPDTRLPTDEDEFQQGATDFITSVHAKATKGELASEGNFPTQPVIMLSQMNFTLMRPLESRSKEAEWEGTLDFQGCLQRLLGMTIATGEIVRRRVEAID